MFKKYYPLSHKLGEHLAEKKLRIATAESCTGGGLAQEITAVPGSSDWFDRGFVTYSNEAKMEMLGVSKKTLDNYGAVSEETAYEMALGALQNSHADITISITGIAGPSGGSLEKPVGLVCFGLAKKNAEVSTRTTQFYGTRHEIQCSSIRYALECLLDEISSMKSAY